jgi:hypothetical protein
MARLLKDFERQPHVPQVLVSFGKLGATSGTGGI